MKLTRIIGDAWQIAKSYFMIAVYKETSEQRGTRHAKEAIKKISTDKFYEVLERCEEDVCLTGRKYSFAYLAVLNEHQGLPPETISTVEDEKLLSSFREFKEKQNEHTAPH
jgi:hypothetical protein